MTDARYPYIDAAGVLTNKWGITDRDTLERVEYGFAVLRARCMPPNSTRTYDLDRQQAIHKHLFDDVYGWAGKLRTVPISKFNPQTRAVTAFVAPEKIADDWRALERKIGLYLARPQSEFNHNRAALTEIYIEANRIHPFPEGNGRSLQMFMRSLAREQGIELDYSRTTAVEWNRASALSATHGRLFERTHFVPLPSDNEPIRLVFERIAAPAIKLENSPGLQPFVMNEETQTRFRTKPDKQHEALTLVERTARTRGYNETEVARVVANARSVIAAREKAGMTPRMSAADAAARPSIQPSSESYSQAASITPKRGY